MKLKLKHACIYIAYVDVFVISFWGVRIWISSTLTEREIKNSNIILNEEDYCHIITFAATDCFSKQSPDIYPIFLLYTYHCCKGKDEKRSLWGIFSSETSFTFSWGKLSLRVHVISNHSIICWHIATLIFWIKWPASINNSNLQ